MDYTSLGKVQYILVENQIPILDTIYTDSVELTYVSPGNTTEKIKKDLLEATRASIEITPKAEIYSLQTLANYFCLTPKTCLLYLFIISAIYNFCFIL